MKAQTEVCLSSVVILMISRAGESNADYDDKAVPRSSDHRAIEFKFIQNSLIRDLRDLHRMADSLEQQLLAERRTKWVIHSSL